MIAAWLQNYPRCSFLTIIERMAVYRTVRPIAPEEAALVDMKVNLSQALCIRHDTAGLSQSALAKRLRSSQSRVAKMEAADRTISIDLLVRGLVILVATPQDIARALGRETGAAA